MKWSLNELQQAKDDPIEFKTTLNLKDELCQRRPEIIKVDPIQIQGSFTADQRGVLGNFNVKTRVQMPSTRTFKPVTIPLDFDFSEYYVSHYQTDLSAFDDLDVVIVLEKDVLVLEDLVIDNILVQIPMQILSDEERQAEINSMPQGNHWGVFTEQQLKDHAACSNQIDPRMEKLKEFFKDNDNKNSDE